LAGHAACDAETANKNGVRTVGLANHYFPGMDFDIFRRLPDEVSKKAPPGMTILVGAELCVLDTSGTIRLSKAEAQQLDFIIPQLRLGWAFILWLSTREKLFGAGMSEASRQPEPPAPGSISAPTPTIALSLLDLTGCSPLYGYSASEQRILFGCWNGSAVNPKRGTP
jgi:hypothetical protein